MADDEGYLCFRDSGTHGNRMLELLERQVFPEDTDEQELVPTEPTRCRSYGAYRHFYLASYKDVAPTELSAI